MAVETNEIDLYADDLGEEFNQENDYNETGLDLYDDVITPSANIKRGDDEDYGLPEGNGTVHHVNSNDGAGDSIMIGSGPPSKKIGLYVGNLSWWTTDQDVMDAVYDIGVNDIFEVKFFENRANGQSKGFCVITLGSDSSVRTVIEKLGKSEIHGQNPVVTPCNRQNLNHFEMQSRKTAPGGPGGGPQHVGGQPNFNQRGGPPQGPPGMRPPLIQRPVRPNGPLIPGQPRMAMGPHQGMPPFGGGQPGGWGPGMPPNGPPRPPAPMHPGAPPMGNMPLMRLPPQPNRGPVPQQPLLRGPGNQNDPRSQMPHPGGPGMPPEWAQDGHPGHPHGPPPQQMMMGPQPGQPQPNPGVIPPRVPQNDGFPGPMPGMPPVNPHGGPAPHINPQFFQAQHHSALAPQQPTDQYGNRLPPGAVQYGQGDFRGPVPQMEMPATIQISEQEFEEIMAKNKNVSSSAIARAVNDASSGDFPQAIETLVTAISLIKQSKVANDERCKILISSLQDTLHGIETKSYSNTSRKERPRSRDRSHERSSRREKSRRDRSRSRERDYRDRSRDRYHDSDRYHESERYREKERERERDHRSSRH